MEPAKDVIIEEPDRYSVVVTSYVYCIVIGYIPKSVATIEALREVVTIRNNNNIAGEIDNNRIRVEYREKTRAISLNDGKDRFSVIVPGNKHNALVDAINITATMASPMAYTVEVTISDWILETGYWEDKKHWNDFREWID